MIRLPFERVSNRTMRLDRLKTIALRHGPEAVLAALDQARADSNAETVRIAR
jgi:hypothetical protein